jgi:hypothetical protein
MFWSENVLKNNTFFGIFLGTFRHVTGAGHVFVVHFVRFSSQESSEATCGLEKRKKQNT